jgi:hypothetical protein
MKKLLVVLSLVLASFSFQASAATFFLTNSSNANNQFGIDTVADAQIVKGPLATTWFFRSDTAGAADFRVEGNEFPFSVNVFSGVTLLHSFIFDNTDKVFSLSFLANSIYDVVVGANSGSQFGILSIQASAVNAVPVPAAVWLFGSALMGLTGISRRKKA